MFRIVEEGPTKQEKQEKEFEAVKKLVIEGYRHTWMVLAVMFTFPIITLFGCYVTQMDFLEGLTTGFTSKCRIFFTFIFFCMFTQKDSRSFTKGKNKIMEE